MGLLSDRNYLNIKNMFQNKEVYAYSCLFFMLKVFCFCRVVMIEVLWFLVGSRCLMSVLDAVAAELSGQL